MQAVASGHGNSNLVLMIEAVANVTLPDGRSIIPYGSSSSTHP